MPSFPHRHRALACAALAAAVVALPGCGSGESAEEGEGVTATKSDAGLVDWPLFGRVPERTHYLPTEKRLLDPPLRQAWQVNTHGLIEFPPAIAEGVAYVTNKFGNTVAIRLSDRKILWRRAPDPRDRGKPTDVTAPVYHQGKVFLADLGGDLVALDADDGKPIWEHDLHAHLESSPMAVKGTLYLGDDAHEVLALSADDGKQLWRFEAPGAIKASPSFHDGRLYVADYEGGMYCLDADSGKPIWRTNTTRVAPFGRGGFFSSPGVGFGQVFAGRDDGTVYGFDEKTGKVTWSFQTRTPLYGSPVIAQVPGTAPTVYIGAENGRFFALDADHGKELWHYDVGGAIPGTATVIGHTVYVSSFATGKTIGIDTGTHKKTFEMKQAGYTPIVSDGRRLYLIGYFVLVGLEPVRR